MAREACVSLHNCYSHKCYLHKPHACCRNLYFDTCVATLYVACCLCCSVYMLMGDSITMNCDDALAVVHPHTQASCVFFFIAYACCCLGSSAACCCSFFVIVGIHVERRHLRRFLFMLSKKSSSRGGWVLAVPCLQCNPYTSDTCWHKCVVLQGTCVTQQSSHTRVTCWSYT